MSRSLDTISRIRGLACLRAMLDAQRGLDRKRAAREQCESDLAKHDAIAGCQAANRAGMHAGIDASVLRRFCLYDEKLAGRLEQAKENLDKARGRVEREKELLSGIRKNLASHLARKKATETTGRRIDRERTFHRELREEEEWIESSRAAGCPGFVHPVRFFWTPGFGPLVRR